jgi:hypothetical protein
MKDRSARASLNAAWALPSAPFFCVANGFGTAVVVVVDTVVCNVGFIVFVLANDGDDNFASFTIIGSEAS